LLQPVLQTVLTTWKSTETFASTRIRSASLIPVQPTGPSYSLCN
jgi:hypothetical protein